MKYKKEIFKDDNGTECIFSCEQFNCILRRMQKRYMKTDNKSVSLNVIYEQIGSEVGASPDTVKNWYYGKNAPIDYEMVKRIARAVRVEVQELMESADPAAPRYVVSVNDKKLIDEVFQMNLVALIEGIWFQPDENGESPSAQFRKNRENTIAKLRKIHQYINCQSLHTSNTLRNLLHRIVLESEEIVIDQTPPIFTQYLGNEYSLIVETECSYGTDRNRMLHDNEIYSRCYILNEIVFANDLQLDDIVDADDEFDNLGNSSLDAFEKYGYHGELDIVPTMVYEHHLTEWMTDLYKAVFEDYL